MNDKERKLWLQLDYLFKTVEKSKWKKTPTYESTVRSGYRLLDLISQEKPYNKVKLDNMNKKLGNLIKKYKTYKNKPT